VSNVPAVIEMTIQVLEDVQKIIPVAATNSQISLFRSESLLFSSPNPNTDDIKRSFNDEELDACTLALEILYNFFGWIPLDKYIKPTIVAMVLNFSKLNDPSNVSLGILALNCINELMTRNFFPPEFNEYLYLVFGHAFDILTYFSQGNAEDALQDLDEQYRIKFTDLLSALIQNHLHRIDENHSFPLHQFLDLLYHYTFNQPSITATQECLSIWTRILDYVYLMNEKNGTSVTSERFLFFLLKIQTFHSKVLLVAFPKNSIYAKFLNDQ
jgi:hypothetical protein